MITAFVMKELNFSVTIEIQIIIRPSITILPKNIYHIYYSVHNNFYLNHIFSLYEVIVTNSTLRNIKYFQPLVNIHKTR